MWTYVQSTGQLLTVDDGGWKVVGTGYSGKGEHKNDPGSQALHNLGPIPRGFYTIGPPVNSETHGPFCLPLIPDASNAMFGRAFFLIHGDSKQHPGEASEGCIIQNRATREAVWNSGDRRLQVVPN